MVHHNKARHLVSEDSEALIIFSCTCYICAWAKMNWNLWEFWSQNTEVFRDALGWHISCCKHILWKCSDLLDWACLIHHKWNNYIALRQCLPIFNPSGITYLIVNILQIIGNFFQIFQRWYFVSGTPTRIRSIEVFRKNYLSQNSVSSLNSCDQFQMNKVLVKLLKINYTKPF